MPGLTPPVNYEQVYKVLAIGFLLCASIYCLRSNHLPHVGDNIHSLPHGGNYADGTKRVQYFRPHSSTSTNHKYTALCAVLTLSLLIFAQTRLAAGNRRTSVSICHHCSSQGSLSSSNYGGVSGNSELPTT
nr:triple block protein 2 [Narcissus mosaic virus]